MCSNPSATEDTREEEMMHFKSVLLKVLPLTWCSSLEWQPSGEDSKHTLRINDDGEKNVAGYVTKDKKQPNVSLKRELLYEAATGSSKIPMTSVVGASD
ncbi:hypothetical protein TNCV_1111541 [Trichonephila clavipes]|nr:hypothetical protein TNCV_1111541 [Trichonephila clavipes]